MKSSCVRVIQLGRQSFARALISQNKFSEAVLRSSQERKLQIPSTNTPKNYLLLVEHDPVYTIGIRRELYMEDEIKKLESLGADFHKTNRGGLITFHGPGQLVAYPVIYLKDFGLTMRNYIRYLEKTVIDVCGMYGVTAGTTCDTGVWVGDEKIAAIGVHGRRYVTTHGLALNCNVDLTWFDHIVPCGIEGKGVTSLSRLTDNDVTVEEVTPRFLEAFAKHFKCSFENGTLGEMD